MRIIKGAPTDDVRKTHVRVMPWIISDLEKLGVPLIRYTQELDGQPGMVRAPKWAAKLVNEWHEIGGMQTDVLRGSGDLIVEFTLQRVIAYVAKTGDEEFAEACVSVLRLNGNAAVEAMLRDRMDLLL